MADIYKSVELAEGIKIGDILNNEKGAIFEIKSEFSDPYQAQSYFEDGDDEINNEFDEEDYAEYRNPWDMPFEQLKLKMDKISDYVYKSLKTAGNPDKPCPERARVTMHYNGYYEGKTEGPYDSTYLRGEPNTYIIPDVVLPGLYESIRTMCEGETSWFWISYKKMFLEKGCPPRIPEKTDLLFEIKIIKFVEIGKESALEDLDETNTESPFEEVKKKVHEVRTNGNALFRQCNYTAAASMYQRSVQALETCKLKDENEQKEQQETLIILYRNLAICFNKKGLPKKACTAINNLKSLMDITKDSRIMFAQGKAFGMLGEFEKAKRAYCTALRMEPTNQEIIKELEILEEKAKKHRETELAIARSALKMVGNTGYNKNAKKQEPDEFDKKRREGIKKELIKFKDGDKDRLNLPDSFSVPEIAMIEELAKELEMKLVPEPREHGETYYLTKN